MAASHLRNRLCEVLLAAERLREKMHAAHHLVTTRRQGLRNHEKCFIGSETVDWLVQQGEAKDRLNAVVLMIHLSDHDLIHHVNDESAFKDDKQFYRFRRDDGTCSELNKYGLVLKAQRMCLRHKQSQEATFTGSQLIAWMVSQGEARSEQEALVWCKEMLDFGLLEAVNSDNDRLPFSDEVTYRFMVDLDVFSNRKFYLLLEPDEQVQAPKRSQDTPKSRAQAREHTDSTHSDDSGCSRTISESSDDTSPSNHLQSVELRTVTAEELLDPASGFVKRSITVTRDEVGYGFVVRGQGPCYVQAVDPQGPAVAAGLKIRQYIYSINGDNVLAKSHREIANLILNQPRIFLVVMQHYRLRAH